MNRATLSSGLIAAAMLLGCDGQTPSEPRFDSGSHWLMACESDSECGGLECECGFCTRTCEAPSECRDGACFDPSTAATCESAAAAICGVLCASDSACEDGQTCLGGVCIRPLPTADVDGGLTDVGDVAPSDGGDDDAASDARQDTALRDTPVDTVPDDTPPVDVEPMDTGAGDSARGDSDVAPTDTIGTTDSAGDADAADGSELEICDRSECSEMLAAPRWRCPDGTPGGDLCVRVSPDACDWVSRECPQDVLSCYGSGDCPDDLICNASDMCVSDPECPSCDVCFGWCVFPDSACTREECGASPGLNRRCEDSSLAGPLCVRGGDETCSWEEFTCE